MAVDYMNKTVASKKQLQDTKPKVQGVAAVRSVNNDIAPRLQNPDRYIDRPDSQMPKPPVPIINNIAQNKTEEEEDTPSGAGTNRATKIKAQADATVPGQKLTAPPPVNNGLAGLSPVIPPPVNNPLQTDVNAGFGNYTDQRYWKRPQFNLDNQSKLMSQAKTQGVTVAGQRLYQRDIEENAGKPSLGMMDQARLAAGLPISVADAAQPGQTSQPTQPVQPDQGTSVQSVDEAQITLRNLSDAATRMALTPEQIQQMQNAAITVAGLNNPITVVSDTGQQIPNVTLGIDQLARDTNGIIRGVRLNVITKMMQSGVRTPEEAMQVVANTSGNIALTADEMGVLFPQTGSFAQGNAIKDQRTLGYDWRNDFRAVAPDGSQGNVMVHNGVQVPIYSGFYFNENNGMYYPLDLREREYKPAYGPRQESGGGGNPPPITIDAGTRNYSNVAQASYIRR